MSAPEGLLSAAQLLRKKFYFGKQVILINLPLAD